MTQDVVHDLDGHTATVDAVTDRAVRVRLPEGVVVELDRSLVEPTGGGGYRADLRFSDLDARVLQEVEERVEIRTEASEIGRVVVRTVTDTVEEPIEADGWRETVDVERVPIGREVDAVEPPHEDGGVTVIPVYEEVLVIRKQLVLREEVRLTRRREPVSGPSHVARRRQRVEVDRLPPSDAGPTEG
jgi:stress response protein YsnF